MGSISVILFLISISHVWTFKNPVLEGRLNFKPGAIKHNGTYFIAFTSTDKDKGSKMPIYESTDFEKWETFNHIFGAPNIPGWADKNSWFGSPEIHKIGENFNVYFSAETTGSSITSIGVAIADNPLGPFVSTDRPLLTDSSGSVNDPTIINDDGSLYLVWVIGGKIKGRPLSPSGLRFSSDEVTELLSPDLPWENSYIDGPWYLQKGKYHYLLYTGNKDCNMDQGIGVARSSSPLGPYEKKAEPIFVSTSDFEGPSQCSIVKDLDDENDVIVAQAFYVGDACGDPFPIDTILASISWSTDDWPIIDF